ncbi:MAG: hypothetical protein KF861_20775 [Planctomycetaceae bacterium]|nr:hypothetical protein [Planctomycetaceae bacterium]
MLVRCLVLSTVVSVSSWAEQARAAEAMVVRVYSVAEIVRTVPDYPYRPGLPTTGPSPVSAGVGGAGEAVPSGGGMGGGGVGGGGGGFFQIGAGMGGLGTTVHNDIDTNALIDVIQQTISPASWSSMGGEATILALGTSLVIRQTEEAHREIRQLLDALSQMADHQTMLTIQTFLLTTAPGDEAHGWATRIAAAQNDKTLRGPLLDDLQRAADESGRINCFSGQKVHLASGQRRSIVRSAVPVVSAYVVGYQPVVDYPHIGTILELSASIDSAGQSALLDIICRSTEWNDAGDPVRIVSESGAGRAPSSANPQRFGPAVAPAQVDLPGARSEAAIDRINMGTRELATTVRVPVAAPGEPPIPFIVGTLGQTTRPGGDPAAAKQITYLVVAISRAGTSAKRDVIN